MVRRVRREAPDHRGAGPGAGPAPQPGLLGQTLAQVILTERAETWLSRYRSETRRRILVSDRQPPAPPGRTPRRHSRRPAAPAALAAGPAQRRHRAHPDRQPQPGVRPAERGPLRLGLLPPAADRGRPVRPAPASPPDPAPGPGPPVGPHADADRQGAPPPRRPRQSVARVAVGLLGDNNFEAFAGELFLALLLDADEVPGNQINAAVVLAAAEVGFRDSRTGEPPDEHAVGWAVHATSNLCGPSACWRPAATGPTADTASPTPARPPPGKPCEPGPPAREPSPGPDPHKWCAQVVLYLVPPPKGWLSCRSPRARRAKGSSR